MNPKTEQATNREVAAKAGGAAGVFALGFGSAEVLPESEPAAVFALLSLAVLLFGIPWMQEAIGRTLLWKNTRGYHADER